jgi:hypothetical protein
VFGAIPRTCVRAHPAVLQSVMKYACVLGPQINRTETAATVQMVWTGWPQNGPRDGWKADFQPQPALQWCCLARDISPRVTPSGTYEDLYLFIPPFNPVLVCHNPLQSSSNTPELQHTHCDNTSLFHNHNQLFQRMMRAPPSDCDFDRHGICLIGDGSCLRAHTHTYIPIACGGTTIIVE